MDFVIHFGDTIAAFSQQHSEWLLPLFFVLIFCETGLVLTPFLPGSTLLLIAGGFAARGDFALYEIVGLLAVAATLGDSMGFFFGRLLGLNSRFIKPAYLAKANAFQTRFGAKAYALARFVPIARGLVPFIAGANGVPYRVFLPPNATGVVLCVTSFCAAGYFSAELQQVPPLAWGWAQESLSGAACAGVRSRRFRTMHRTAQRPLSHQGQNMNTRTSPDRNAPLRWSIVSTLAVLYTIATLAVLALAGSYLYLALESELLLRDTATVSHQVRRLRQGVGEAKAGDTPERWSRRWAEHAEGDPRFQSRVLDASNNVVAMTAGMAQLQAAFPPPTGLAALPAAGWRWNDASSSHSPTDCRNSCGCHQHGRRL